MPILTIGKTEIPYGVRYSSRARHKRIVVVPEGVEVVAPVGTPDEGPDSITAFLHTKRRWLFDAVREIAERQGKLLTQHYASGAKLQYRGRWLMLDVQSGEADEVGDEISVSCKSKFHLTVPEDLSGAARSKAVKDALDAWLKARAERDLLVFTRRHAALLKLDAKLPRISDAKYAWGSCGKDGIIRIHWRLIQAPKVAMEYVVAHELTHLLHRNHSPAFWKQLSKTMPHWPEAKAILERWEGEHRAV